jgi:phosphoribosylformylglycinamidine cyclo-ligase
MPGVYLADAFDLVGTMVGWVERDAIVDGHTVRAGDMCLGLPSSGLHTNGYSLARRVFAETSWDTVLPELGKPLGQVLLTPHRSYLKELETLWAAGVQVKAMAHITGGGFTDNIPRMLPADVGVHIDQSAWKTPAIFDLIQEWGHVDEMEMYRVFNMGIGMVLLVSPEQVEQALATLLGQAVVIGQAVPWDGNAPRVRL